MGKGIERKGGGLRARKTGVGSDSYKFTGEEGISSMGPEKQLGTGNHCRIRGNIQNRGVTCVIFQRDGVAVNLGSFNKTAQKRFGVLERSDMERGT